MVIILICRFVKPGCEDAFLRAYELGRTPDNPHFIEETLTRVTTDGLPDSLQNLELASDDCITYLNVATWRSWEAFDGLCDMSGAGFDPTYEVASRKRAVLEIINTGSGNDSGDLPTLPSSPS